MGNEHGKWEIWMVSNPLPPQSSICWALHWRLFFVHGDMPYLCQGPFFSGGGCCSCWDGSSGMKCFSTIVALFSGCLLFACWARVPSHSFWGGRESNAVCRLLLAFWDSDQRKAVWGGSRPVFRFFSVMAKFYRWHPLFGERFEGPGIVEWITGCPCAFLGCASYCLS